MKDKITISLDETILARIDKDVKALNWKNRSAIIENILKERYGDFIDVTTIIFAHDYKWDNRPYPFNTPKSLLKVKEKSVISRQIDIFSKAWITNIIITIPKETRKLFEEELVDNFKNINFAFIEMDSNLKTGQALKETLKFKNTNDKLIIANWDIYYWNLDLENYYKYHLEQKSDFSFLLKFVINPEQLGNIRINGNKIIEFVEKPKANALFLTNSGLYITSRKFLDKHNFWDYLEYDFFTKLSKIANTIWYIYTGQWEHIQNDSAYERVNWWIM